MVRPNLVQIDRKLPIRHPFGKGLLLAPKRPAHACQKIGPKTEIQGHQHNLLALRSDHALVAWS